MHVRIAYLQACKAIDSENKIKQQSPHHTQTLTFTHTCTHSSTHSLSCSPSPFRSLSLTLSHSSTMKAIELNHCRWQFSAICPKGVGAGTSTGDDVGVDTTSCSAALRTAEQRSAACACCCSGCAALSHFAFHVLTQRTRLCPPPRAAFAVDIQCEMKSRG